MKIEVLHTYRISDGSGNLIINIRSFINKFHFTRSASFFWINILSDKNNTLNINIKYNLNVLILMNKLY